MRRFIFKTPKCLTWGFRAQLMAFIEVTRHLMDLIQLPNFTFNRTTHLVPTFKRCDLFKIQNYTPYFQHVRAAWQLLPTPLNSTLEGKYKLLHLSAQAHELYFSKSIENARLHRSLFFHACFSHSFGHSSICRPL